jgi:hypothetical protein
LIDAGVIKKIAPILDLEKIEEHVLAVVELKVEASTLSQVTEALAGLDEVRNVYATTGEYSVMFSVVSNSLRALQTLLTDRISTIPGVSSLSYRVVTRIVKDDPGVPLRPGLGIRLMCDECGKEISGQPEVMRVGKGSRYFCCKTCLSRYKETYGARLEKLQESGAL